jgi:hypothetical protein
LFDLTINVGTASVIWYNISTGEVRGHLENAEQSGGRETLWYGSPVMNQRLTITPITSYNTNALGKRNANLVEIRNTDDSKYINYLESFIYSRNEMSSEDYLAKYYSTSTIGYGFTAGGLYCLQIGSYRKITMSLTIMQKRDRIEIKILPTLNNNWWTAIVVRDLTYSHPHNNWYRFQLLITANV